eukprot:TRINITY_DN27388_c0_g1_i1.p1 TRINITY_DN27388_c0_g1~~TRINITY_DN27388_c0_g1_i1.p1  ORF type:complete len:400 (+),score=57.77 TRINITY_DN27388_c0_g1_i1:57-1256(+)
MRRLSLKEALAVNLKSNSLLNVSTKSEQNAIEDGISRGGWLLGVKDVFHCDNLPTRVGTPNLVTGEEGTIIKRLKAAGAIPIKTSMTPLIYMDPCSGCIHPDRPSESASGSSTGSAVAVSTGQVRFSLGTQCSGSVIRPGAYHNIIAFKPSKGSVPTDGMEYFSKSIDQIGYFTRTIPDARWLHSICISDSEFSPPDPDTPDYPPPSSLSKFSFGCPQNDFLIQSKINIFDVIDEGVLCFKNMSVFSDLEAVYRSQLQLAHYEGRERWYNFWKHDCQGQVAPKIDKLMSGPQEILEPEAGRYRDYMKEVRDGIGATMKMLGVDVLLCPSTVERVRPSLSENSTGNPAMNIPWNFAGVPVLNIPVPGSDLLSVQLIAKHGDDDLLLEAGRAFQRMLEEAS